MGLEFKKDIRLNKVKLLEAGRVLLCAKEECKQIQNNLDLYNKESSIFTDDIQVQTKDIDEHLEMIELALGKLDLEEVIKK